MQHDQSTQEYKDHKDVSLVLLSKTEFLWLCGEAKVSKDFEYQIRSRIKKKPRL
jgi:hypothetical protein